MYHSQDTHPVYVEHVSPSTANRLYEYKVCSRWIRPTDVVLDFGCNSGLGLDVLRHMAATVHGIDVIPSLQPFLKAKYAGTNVVPVIVKEGDMPYEDGFFDAIVAMNIIEHVPDPKAYVRLLYRKLKPGGRLIMSTVNRRLRLFPWQKPFNPHHFDEFTDHSLRRLLRGCFNDVSVHGIEAKPPFFPDHAREAFRCKWRLGVVYPLRNWARRWIRPLLSVLLPSRYPAVASALPESDDKPLPQEQLSLEPLNLDDFEQAFRCLEFAEQCGPYSLKLYSVSTRR